MGFAVGFEIDGLLSPVDGVQEYELPPVPLSVVLLPIQMAVLLPALIIGNAFTTMVTAADFLQPFTSVTNTV